MNQNRIGRYHLEICLKQIRMRGIKSFNFGNMFYLIQRRG